jgi:ATP-dependent DNA helicase RecQ
LLNNYKVNTDDKKRELYVAMTRAKQNLSFHSNSNYLRNIHVENLNYKQDNNSYPEPEKLTLHLSHRDIYLSYFKYIQRRLNALVSGQKLLIGEEGLANTNDELIIKFSRQFAEKKEGLEKDGFKLIKANVNFILYWKPEEEETEVMIVLPELLFKKQINNTNY